MIDPLPPEVGIPPDVPEGTITDIRAGNKPIGPPYFIPPPDTNQTFALPRFAPVWNDVWDWTKNAASDVLGWFQSAPSISEAAVQRIVESYVGESQKAMSSFIDDAVNFAAYGLNAVNTFAYDATNQLLSDVESLAVDTGNLFLQDDRYSFVVIPSLLNAIAGVAAGIDAKILNAQAGVEQWAVDNIFKPLYESIGNAEAQASQLVDAKTAAALGEAKAFTLDAIQPIYGELAQHAAQISVVVAAATALQRQADECVTDMCSYAGPKTNFPSLLRALEALLGVAAAGAALSLTENDLENIAQSFAGIRAGSIDQFLAGFVGGGETLGAAGTGLLSDAGGIATKALADVGISIP